MNAQLVLHEPHHADEFAEYVVVSHTKHAIAFVTHEGVAIGVVRGIGVRDSADFNDEFG